MFAIALATFVELAGGPGWDLGGHGAGDWLAARSPASCTTDSGSGSSSPACARSRPRWPGRSCRSSRYSGSRPGYLVGERLEPRQWVGAVVIVAATAAIAIRQRTVSAVQPVARA